MTAEWAALHRRARPGSPFEHPAWAGTWARRFVPDGQLHVVTVRNDHGDLVAVAPLYRRRWLCGGPASLQPLGTGHHQALTEVVQVLVDPAVQETSLRAIVQHLEDEGGWDWLHLSLGPAQGWLVPQWLSRPHASTILQRLARACVVVDPLPKDREALLRSLRRNVRESVRRGTNRAARFGGVTFQVTDDGEALTAAVDAVFRLHRARSQMPGKVAHGDSVADPAMSAFVGEAVRSLAKTGLARVHLALHRDKPVAGLVVLSDGHTDYLSLSGLDPEFWDLNLNTLLIWEALVWAAEQGRARVNLSSGPDAAKLRWSRRVSVFQDFTLVRRRRRSQASHAAFAHLQLAVEHRAARRRHLRGKA